MQYGPQQPLTPGDPEIFCSCPVSNAVQVIDGLRRRTRVPQPPAPRRKDGRAGWIWAREWLTQRQLHGDYDQLVQELNKEDRKGHKNFLRIYPELFEEMVERLTPLLKKKDMKMRLAQEVGLKFAVTLCHLASGNDYTSLQYSFIVSKSSICRFIPVVCQTIIDIYKPEVMKCPKTPEEWNDVAKRFASKWNYFNCVGALDGKNVTIKKPKGGGSLYFNYKKFHSIILMALSDAKYKPLFVDVGAGGAGDGGTWHKCNLARDIANNRAGLPKDRNLPNNDEPIPFHIVADDTWLMKPYSQQSQDPTEQIYSYRLSRTRRVVENAFGLLQMRWRVFGMTMQQNVQRLLTNGDIEEVEGRGEKFSGVERPLGVVYP
ncbi:uncharacterized protein LOC135212852 [Macrobrachium nipponense]|uniref:uncharacterized protein LOC135212852 n=1 Tax=Macrobrachium nipponense TaxID=159736 RepID=UPI0030C85991